MKSRTELADLDQSGNDPTPHQENTDLFECRLAMLGLDARVIKQGDGDTFESIRQRCKTCNTREACVVDLKRDPNDPVWETYCPNARVLNALPEADWLAPIVSNYWRRHYPQR